MAGREAKSKLLSPSSQDNRFSTAAWKDKFGDVDFNEPLEEPSLNEEKSNARVEEEQELEIQDQQTEKDTLAEDAREPSEDGDEPPLTLQPKPATLKQLKKFEKLQQSIESRGVVYLSRIPPFMRVDKLRFLLSQCGQVDRMFLTPEDQSIAKRRKKSGGNKAQRFVDGWVEFVNKKDAKRAALTLNNQIIGGKKRNFYHDDIWNIQYLKGFKWTNLTERIAQEKRTREQKIRNDQAEAKRTAKWYTKKVNENKALESMEERQQKKLSKRKLSLASEEDTVASSKRVNRQFKQRQLIQHDIVD